MGAVLPFISAVGTAIGSWWSQARQNKKDREFQEHMYQEQREDALEDWEMNNAYNHPQQQMQRLREAGLNPHLVYGKGAANTATMVRGSQASAPNQPAPPVINAFSEYQNIARTQAETDNLHTLNQIRHQENALKAAQVENTLIKNDSDTLSLEIARATKDQAIEQANLANKLTESQIQVILDQNDRQELANSSNVALTWEKLLTQKQQTAKSTEEVKRLQETHEAYVKTQNAEAKINQATAVLRNMGIQAGDEVWQRVIIQALFGNTFNAEDIKDIARKWKKFPDDLKK